MRAASGLVRAPHVAPIAGIDTSLARFIVRTVSPVRSHRRSGPRFSFILRDNYRFAVPGWGLGERQPTQSRRGVMDIR